MRQAYYDAIAPLGLTPLWEVLHALVPPQPVKLADSAFDPKDAERYAKSFPVHGITA